MRPLPLLPLLVLLVACAGGKSSATDDTGASPDDGADGGADGADGADGGDGGDGPCPPEVPAAYQYLWDCEALSCEGAPKLYRAAAGSSTADGDIAVEEQWFIFFGPGDYCTDTFTIAGSSSPIDPSTFNCSECEETFEVTWELATPNNCGLIWGSLFIDDDEVVEGPFDGFLMFDTHSPLSGRNPDNAMLTVAAPYDGTYVYPDPNWARGTATPSTAVDGPPEDYVYANQGVCLGG